MTLQDYRDSFSDFHKEAYGFRPRHDTSHWTLADWEQEWADLRRMCDANAKEQAASEAAAIVELEARIVKLIGMGAADREAAIRWIADGEQAGDDREYLCFCLGLPYGYFKTPACAV